MLFLGVFFGFLAENLREDTNNHETESKNMEIIVSNLRSDTAQMAAVINANIIRTKAIDNPPNQQDKERAWD